MLLDSVTGMPVGSHAHYDRVARHAVDGWARHILKNPQEPQLLSIVGEGVRLRPEEALHTFEGVIQAKPHVVTPLHARIFQRAVSHPRVSVVLGILKSSGRPEVKALLAGCAVMAVVATLLYRSFDSNAGDTLLHRGLSLFHPSRSASV